MNRITCICCGTSYNKDKINIHRLTNRHFNNLKKEIKQNKQNKNDDDIDDKFYEWFNDKDIKKNNDKYYEWFKK